MALYDYRFCMMLMGWLQIVTFMAAIGLLTWPLGAYLTKVYSGQRTPLQPLLSPIEQTLYRFAGVKAESEQSWLQYTTSFLIFHALPMDGRPAHDSNSQTGASNHALRTHGL